MEPFRYAFGKKNTLFGSPAKDSSSRTSPDAARRVIRCLRRRRRWGGVWNAIVWESRWGTTWAKENHKNISKISVERVEFVANLLCLFPCLFFFLVPWFFKTSSSFLMLHFIHPGVLVFRNDICDEVPWLFASFCPNSSSIQSLKI